jgi:hypothetical protein
VSVQLSVDNVQPAMIVENEPVKVTWTVQVGDHIEARSLVVTLLTDDARLILLDPKSQESPPEWSVAVQPGQKITKTWQVMIQRRKGLIDEHSRDGGGSPFFLLGRVRHDSEVLASAVGVEVEFQGLAKRAPPRIFG